MAYAHTPSNLEQCPGGNDDDTPGNKSPYSATGFKATPSIENDSITRSNDGHSSKESQNTP